MDRFKYIDQQEPQIIGFCPACGESIMEGEDIVYVSINDEDVHENCLIDYALKNLEAEYKIAGEE